MKKFLTGMISVIMLFELSLGYTFTLKYETETATMEVDAGETLEIGLPDRSPAEYVVNVGDIILKTLGNRRRFVMPAENVEIAIRKPNIETYRVSFESNGGGVVSSKTVVYGETYKWFETPVREGYTFEGWYKEPELLNMITEDSIVSTANDHMLYAKWYSIIPNFTYTGDYETSFDDTYWYIYLKSDGTLAMKDTRYYVDAFLVGGGGGGGYDQGGGGGGGYTATYKGLTLVEENSYEIDIGDGGSASTSATAIGGKGKATSAFGRTVQGGYGGTSYNTEVRRVGGNGGSGGGCGGETTSIAGIGGTDGGDGNTVLYSGGKGQGTTTRAFGATDGTLYAGGGGGTNGTSTTSNVPQPGGAGGGAAGMTSAAANTGGGGGGGALGAAGGNGGSGIVIIRGPIGLYEISIPSYTYTGKKVIRTDDKYWYIEMLSDGTLTIENPLIIDVFLVGGGGGGGYDQGAGGGGGYTATYKGLSLGNGTSYEISIGAGGSTSSSSSATGGRGGTTTAFGKSAEGGYGGYSYGTSARRIGGNGGSGGGCGGETTDAAGKGGADGENGSAVLYSGGTGQGSTTRAFGETDGALYAGGGGGTGNGTKNIVQFGGAGGGADGMSSAAANTGGGGGGGVYAGAGGNGGSGIVIIRGIL